MADLDELLTNLFDVLVRRPDGVTLDEISAELEVPPRRARSVIRTFRLTFGEDDTINLICDPNGQNNQWLYRLTGSMVETEPWAKNRLDDAEARLTTMSTVLASVERGLDGRSVEGRKARIWRRAIERAREDITELNTAGS